MCVWTCTSIDEASTQATPAAVSTNNSNLMTTLNYRPLGWASLPAGMWQHCKQQRRPGHSWLGSMGNPATCTCNSGQLATPSGHRSTALAMNRCGQPTGVLASLTGAAPSGKQLHFEIAIRNPPALSCEAAGITGQPPSPGPGAAHRTLSLTPASHAHAPAASQANSLVIPWAMPALRPCCRAPARYQSSTKCCAPLWASSAATRRRRTWPMSGRWAGSQAMQARPRSARWAGTWGGHCRHLRQAGRQAGGVSVGR